MHRLINNDLDRWKGDPRRKPLLIRGARQVGKTYTIRQLGRTFSRCAEVNFEYMPDAAAIFEPDLDPHRIARDLGLLTGTAVIPGETLLFLDEVQEVPKVLTALRYFYEEKPDLHVIAAGSLLDFTIDKVGLPVGRVSSLYLYPLSFAEFLTATDRGHLFQAIEICCRTDVINEAVHNRLNEALGEYIAVGGMPEAVSAWIETGDLQASTAVLRALIETFRQDFGKYARRNQVKYVDKLFNETPLMLGQKFSYGRITGAYRKRELEPALSLLIQAGLLHKVYHSSGHGPPLGAGARYDRYKTLFLDTALAQTVIGLDTTAWILRPLADMINRGAVAESFVGQELLAYSNRDMRAQIHYWHREARSSNAEIDYLVVIDGSVIPLEVKSGKEGRLRSMHQFMASHLETPYGIRLYSGLPGRSEQIRSYPLYCLPGLVMDSASRASFQAAVPC